MIILLGILIFIIGSCLESSGKDWETSQRNDSIRNQRVIDTINNNANYDRKLAEIRHKEMMSTKQTKGTKQTRKRVIYNEFGKVIAEEIIEVEQ